MTAEGRAFRFGDDVNTDVIIPARYLNTGSAAELAPHCMEDADPAFAARIRPGDVIVAGANFGCGSSREHAPMAIKAAGVSCVIASGFARIFYRNAINIGLPILECPAASAAVREGDELFIDFGEGSILDRTTGERFSAQPFPPFIQGIIARGGLLAGR